jgi:hypothetical protein
MSQDDLTYDLNRCSRPGGICCCMSSQVMRSDMDAHEATGFFDDHPCCWIGYGKYWLVRFDFPLPDILFEAISQLLRYIDNLLFSSRFCIFEDELPVFNILRLQFHAAAGHKLEQETIPWFGCAKDDLINHFFFNDVPTGKLCLPEEFPEYGGIARIFQFLVYGVADEVEESREERLANASGSLSCILGRLIEKGQDFI